MVVGYPDDPDIIAAVLVAMFLHDESGMLESPNFMEAIIKPDVRRAVLAVLPEEPPQRFEMFFPATEITEKCWRWLREEAFRD